MICTTLKINFNPPGNPVISRSIKLNRKHPNSYQRKKESNEINENNDRSKTQLTKSESLPNESPKLISQNLPPPKRRMTEGDSLGERERVAGRGESWGVEVERSRKKELEEQQ